MQALITGGAGFIGSHLAEELLNRGQRVIAFDDISTGNLSNISHLQDVPAFEFHQGTIMDADTLAAVMRQANSVYHLAAAVGVKYVLEHPLTSLETNTKGTENVLRLAHQLGNKKVMIASSSEVYGKSIKVPFREDDDSVMGPTSVSRWGYGCSKAFDEFLALAYYREKGLPVVVLRLFNTVGPRQSGSYGMMLPRLVSQALAGDPITVYGDGKQARTFTFVKDVVRAMADIVLVPQADGEVFNLGTDREISINRLGEVVRKVLDSSSEIVHVPFSQVYGADFEETGRRVPDISKIRRYISYAPNTDLDFIVMETARALRASPEGSRAAGGVDVPSA